VAAKVPVLREHLARIEVRPWPLTDGADVDLGREQKDFICGQVGQSFFAHFFAVKLVVANAVCARVPFVL